MFKLIIKIAIVYAVLQYGFKVDINGYIKPHIEPFLSNAQDELPDAAQGLLEKAQDNLPGLAEELLEKAEPLTDAASDNPVANYVKDRVESLDNAKTSIEALEKKMKEMQEAADKAAEGGN